MKKSLLLLLTGVSLAFAAPALNIEHTYTQSDGTTFKAKPVGDEYLHFVKTKNGDILVYNPKTKNFDYGKIENDLLVPSGIPYGIKSKVNKSAALEEKPSISSEALEKAYQKAKKRFNTH